MKVFVSLTIVVALIGLDLLIANAGAVTHSQNQTPKKRSNSPADVQAKKVKLLSDRVLSEGEADVSSKQPDAKTPVDSETQIDSKVAANNNDLRIISNANTPFEGNTGIHPSLVMPLVPGPGMNLPISFGPGIIMSPPLLFGGRLPLKIWGNNNNKVPLRDQGRQAKSLLNHKFTDNSQWSSFYNLITNAEWNAIGSEQKFSIDGSILESANSFFSCLGASSKVNCIGALLGTRGVIGNVRENMERLLQSSFVFYQAIGKLKSIQKKSELILSELEKMPGVDQEFRSELSKYRSNLRSKAKKS